MIVRVFRARPRPGKEKALEDYYIQTAVPQLQAQKGVRWVNFGRPLERGQEEYVLVSVWESKEDLIAFAGANWRKPKLLANEVDFVQDQVVDHYEMVPVGG
ncbi:MAG TPA: antibiotic biosynthesis monooxygenase family protein [Candidatus Thermoplasmatota archaeon]|nr:antibiotic biosynthesis monooxygenase family protein [Candidatus Thermoplasmatota archaeon]